MFFRADLNKIASFLKKTVDEVKSLSILDLEKVMEDMKKVEIEETAKNPPILEKNIEFFRSYGKFVDLFGKDIVDKYLGMIPFKDLTTNVRYEVGTAPKYKGFVGDFLKKEMWTIKKSHPKSSQYYKDDYTMCEKWVIPSQYQGLMHKRIIEPILLEKFDWLNEFEYSIYEISFNGIPEFYVKTSCGKSLYVPYKAFLGKDIEQIKTRNREYLNWYYNDSNKSYDELIYTPETQKFLSFLE